MTKPAEPNFPAIFTESFNNLREFDRDLINVLGQFAQNLVAILDRGISFDDNVDCRFVTHTFGGTPNTQESISHGLGKVPSGYIPVIKDRSADIYDGGTAHTKTALNLKCTVASAVIKILVF